MIAEAKAHITSALIAAGVPEKRIFDGAAALADTKLVPRAVLHFRLADEKVEPDGSLVAHWIVDGTRVYRRRMFRRTIALMVELAGETDTTVDGWVSALYVNAGYGFSGAGGNWVSLVAGQAEWHEDRAKTSKRTECILELTLKGGIYKDTVHALVSELDESGDVEAG